MSLFLFFGWGWCFVARPWFLVPNFTLSLYPVTLPCHFTLVPASGSCLVVFVVVAGPEKEKAEP